MGLPTKFSQLTLLQFIQLNELSLDNDIEKIDRDAKEYSILSGILVNDVEEMDYDVIKRELANCITVKIPPNNIPLKSKIIVKGTVLYPTVSLQDMKVNQLIDFSNVYKSVVDNHIAKANDLLAIMFKPLSLFGKTKYNPDRHAKISELLLSAKAEDCLGLLFFYLALWRRCEPRIQMLLVESQKIANETISEILNAKTFMDSLNIGDGSIT